MPSYLFNVKDRDGTTVEEIQDEYPNDLHALQHALDLRDGHLIEVWQGERWVAAVGKHTDAFAPPDSAR